jgi:hypothetical protein
MSATKEFPEITTSDIGLALYLLTHSCWIVRVVQFQGQGQGVEHRLQMTFTGYWADKKAREYHAGDWPRIEYGQLLELFRRLTSAVPLIRESREGEADRSHRSLLAYATEVCYE